MPLNADRPINRAIVVRCAISATRNYLKLHGPTELNPLFSNNRAITLKLCTRSSPPLFEFPKSSTSYKSPECSLLSRCRTSRDFVPWRFLDAGRLSVRNLLVAGVQKPTHEMTFAAAVRSD